MRSIAESTDGIVFLDEAYAEFAEKNLLHWSEMYDAIASSDIIMCDFTGQRPNVYVETGFALDHHLKNRLVFLFEPMTDNDKVPFDLNTFKYVQISQAAEIQNKVKPEIIAILRDCGANI